MSVSAHSYLTVAETGELVPEGQYLLGLSPQIKLSDGNGVNLAGFFDSSVRQDASVRLHVGVGETDFFTGASFKWIPFPDFGQQPAIGARVGAIYGRDGDDSLLTFRFDPLVSKKLEIDHGVIEPYGSLPIYTSTFRSRTTTGIQLVGGAQYYPPDFQQMRLGGELGMSLRESFNYVAVFVTFLMDEPEHIQRRK